MRSRNGKSVPLRYWISDMLNLNRPIQKHDSLAGLENDSMGSLNHRLGVNRSRIPGDLLRNRKIILRSCIRRSLSLVEKSVIWFKKNKLLVQDGRCVYSASSRVRSICEHFVEPRSLSLDV